MNLTPICMSMNNISRRRTTKRSKPKDLIIHLHTTHRHCLRQLITHRTVIKNLRTNRHNHQRTYTIPRRQSLRRRRQQRIQVLNTRPTPLLHLYLTRSRSPLGESRQKQIPLIPGLAKDNTEKTPGRPIPFNTPFNICQAAADTAAVTTFEPVTGTESHTHDNAS